MKKTFLFITALFLFAVTANAQKYGHVNSAEILKLCWALILFKLNCWLFKVN